MTERDASRILRARVRDRSPEQGIMTGPITLSPMAWSGGQTEIFGAGDGGFR
jgi:hypothetical protein